VRLEDHRIPDEELQPEPLDMESRHAFFLQLATLFSSGCSLSQSLEAVSRSQESSGLQRVAQSVLIKLERGSPLSAALASEHGFFTSEEISLVRLGEETGKLHMVLQRISQNLEQAIGNRRQFVQAGLYPAAILAFSFLLVGLMAFVLLPKLTPIFLSFQLSLPWPTRLVLSLTSLLPWFLFFCLCTVFFGIVAARQRPDWQKLLFSIPYLETVLRQRSLGEMSASLAILISAGARLDYSFKLLAEQTEDPDIKSALSRVRIRLRRGSSLPDAIGAEDKLPQLWKQLIVVGCETGRVDFFSERLAEIYLEDFRWRLGQAITLMEPILLMGVGGAVGFLLLACFLPFYQLVTVAM
jgi:type II secretory pathway component PulF